MKPAINIRPANHGDLQPAWDTFLLSFQNMVRTLHGLRKSVRHPQAAPPYLAHILATDPRSFWVAEASGRTAGFACAIVRGPIWFLCDFWMLPRFQGFGIGKKLLQQSLQSDRRYKIISTYSSLFPAAMRSYIQLGMTPQFPILTLVGNSKRLKTIDVGRHNLEISDVVPEPGRKEYRDAVNALGAIDRRVRGSARLEDHDFFIRRNGMRCALVTSKGRAVGYFYINRHGQIGPLATRHERDKVPLLAVAVESARRSHGRLTLRVPSPNVQSLRWLLSAGFRIDTHALFMSSAEFGKMENYIISGPAMF